MSLSTLITTLRSDARFMATVAAWHTLPAQPPRTTPFPPALDPRLVAALEARGISRLYTHQAAAAEVALAGGNVAVVTPTASGKTLCYNLPVFHRLLNDPDARALYLFPTKALAQDQLAELNRLAAGIERLATGDGRSEIENRSPISRLFASTYDGDTPSAERPRIRKTARILLTNPDMLHVGILPYHTQWADVLAGLRWVVIDEMHTYRGVFGSQVANVLRRLQRLCTHYGSRPQFVCTSATIANPQMLAARLLEQPVTLVNDNGAPRGEKQIILVNPPLLDPEKGIRRNARLEATDLAAACLRAGLQTIVFGRSRLATELLLTYLRDKVARGRATMWEDELSTANSQWSIANEEDAPAGTRAVHNSQFTIHNWPFAATAAATSPSNAAPSRRASATARYTPSSPPMRWNWASTSASCRPPSSAATQAALPAPGSRWAAPAARRKARWRCWSPRAGRSTSISSSIPNSSSNARPSMPWSIPTT